MVVRSIVMDATGEVRAVAVVNLEPDEIAVFDWAAYVGVGSVAEVVESGDRLLDRWAAAFFPDLPIERYHRGRG